MQHEEPSEDVELHQGFLVPHSGLLVQLKKTNIPLCHKSAACVSEH
jgi:hypothetical protein